MKGRSHKPINARVNRSHTGKAGRLSYFAGEEADGAVEKASMRGLAMAGRMSRSLAWSMVKITRMNFAPLGSST